MNTLRNMEVFVRVAATGSFTAAAHDLDTTVAHASRAVANLEEHFGTRLLNRTTRRVGLTEAGRRYFQRCKQILDSVGQAEAELTNTYILPAGNLKLHSTPSLAQHCLLPLLNDFQARNPSVEVDVTLGERVPDMSEEAFDVSIALSRSRPAEGLCFQFLGNVFSVVCASPSYLMSNGMPQRPTDLTSHRCLQAISADYPENEWEFSGPHGGERIALDRVGFKINAVEALATAVRQGMGIGLLPYFVAVHGIRSGELVHVLPDYRAQERDIFAIYTARRYMDAKVHAWIEFVRNVLPDALESARSDFRGHTATA
jgi:DNA-binding transcriptional LysR family regulator